MSTVNMVHFYFAGIDRTCLELSHCLCVLSRNYFTPTELFVKKQSPHSLVTGNLCIIRRPTIAFEPIAAAHCVTRGHGKWVLVAKTAPACLWSSGRAWAGEGHVSRSFSSSLKRGNELESWAAFFFYHPHPPPLFSSSSTSSNPLPQWHPAKDTWLEDGLIKDKPQSHAGEIACFQLQPNSRPGKQQTGESEGNRDKEKKKRYGMSQIVGAGKASKHAVALFSGHFFRCFTTILGNRETRQQDEGEGEEKKA